MALLLPVTGFCDSRCVFCSAAGRRLRGGLPGLLALVDADRSGRVQISGGEPLGLPPGVLLKVLRHCRRAGKRVELQTNGGAAADYPLGALRLVASLTDSFNVNFPAHEPRLDRAVTGVAGLFARRVKGVRRLLSLGAEVRLTHVVCGPNYRHAEEFADFVLRRLAGVSRVQFSFVKAVGRARGDRAVVPRFRDAAPFLEKAFALCEEASLPFEVDHIPVCVLPRWRSRFVDAAKLRSALSGPHVREKRRIAECRACRLRGECPGPRRDYVELYGGL